MRAATVSVLDEYYADLLGTQPGRLWRELTVCTHRGRLTAYPGYYVVWRGAGVHVSAPEEADPSTVRWLRDQAAGQLQDPAWWRDFAARLGLELIGPSTHAYLDEDPGRADGVEAVDETDLQVLRGLVDEADWGESGWNDRPARAFGLRVDGVLVAASNLNLLHHEPRDIGVVVAEEWRGRGLSVPVGRHAASWAVREHGFAKWSARDRNVASLATARRLGFRPWCAQLAVR